MTKIDNFFECWSPDGPQNSYCPQMVPKGPQMVPGWSPDGPRWSPEVPGGPQRSQMVPRGPQMVARWSPEVPDGPQRSQMVPRGPRWSPALVCSVGMPAFQIRVGDGGDGDGDGRIFPEHPSPILHAPRDIISRKGKSLTPIYIYIYIYMTVTF